MEAKKSYKSFRFDNDLVWTGERSGRSTSPGKPELVVGSPPEFKGKPGQWSPEELLVASLDACLMLTFLSFATHKKATVLAYESHAEGLLQNLEGKYRVTEITVHARIAVQTEADLEIAKEVSTKVEENCFISNSITANVDFVPEFRVGA